MIIKIDSNSPVPKYQQIIQSIIEGVENNVLVKGDRIPSLNNLVKEFGLSQDTVLTAYNELKSNGVITATVGKGYFIDTDSISQSPNIFLMLDKLTAYKEVLYESLKNGIGDKGKVSLCFHYNNKDIFKTLLKDSLNKFTAYIITPILSPDIKDYLNLVPKKKLYLLDQGKSMYGNDYSYVCQDFEEDIYSALKSKIELLQKYESWNLLLHNERPNYLQIKKGFKRLCKEFKIKSRTLKSIPNEPHKLKGLFIVINDKYLVDLVKNAENHNMVLGEQIGVISYNETPLKQIASGGISTLSTDFENMGLKMADLILKKKKAKITNPCNLIIRKSL